MDLPSRSLAQHNTPASVHSVPIAFPLALRAEVTASPALAARARRCWEPQAYGTLLASCRRTCPPNSPHRSFV